MGKTDPEAATHRQQSMLIVPADTPGVAIGRSYPVFGRHDQHGHCLVEFDEVRVPAPHLLGEEGGGFAAAQARLGPGRIHHVMRALGAGERALAMMVLARRRNGSPSAGRWPSSPRSGSGSRSPASSSSRLGPCATGPRTSSTARATRRRGT